MFEPVNNNYIDGKYIDEKKIEYPKTFEAIDEKVEKSNDDLTSYKSSKKSKANLRKLSYEIQNQQNLNIVLNDKNEKDISNEIKIATNSKSEIRDDFKNLTADEFLKKLDEAIITNDYETFLELQKSPFWINLSGEDLRDFTYTLFEVCIDRNDVNLNKNGFKMLEDLLINHPNSPITTKRLTRILECICESGNYEAFEMLMQKHPKYNELDSSQIYSILKEDIEASIGGSFSNDEYYLRQSEGKDRIFFTLIKHKNWDKDLVEFTFKLLSLSINPKVIAEIKNTKGFNDLSAKMLTSLMADLRIGYQVDDYTEEFYKLCIEHKAFKDVDAKMLKKVVIGIFHKNYINYDEIQKAQKVARLFDLIMSHERWQDLNAKDLVDICENMSFFGYREISENFILKLATHPNWQNIDKDFMVEIACSLADENELKIFEIIINHPTWKNFTNEDLMEILRSANHRNIYNNNINELIGIIKTHEKWPNIEKEAYEYLKD